MTYTREVGDTNARFLPGSATEIVSVRSGVLARLVAPGSATCGQFGLFKWIMPARSGGPDPHFHKTFSESFYILSGTVGLYDGRGWVQAGEDDFLYVPEGSIHAFRNDGDTEAAMLILFAPGAPREEYFRELAAIRASGRTLTADEWTALFGRHDQYRAE